MVHIRCIGLPSEQEKYIHPPPLLKILVIEKMDIFKQTTLAMGDFPLAIQKLGAQNKEEPRRRNPCKQNCLRDMLAPSSGRRQRFYK